ncbi:MAG: AmmeMemoRadiSam system radical SAM enzyme [bacterium]|nr:AmmeMemoRadiSam system radical SAM enzyme [Candidatus Sumerlaeota bacterium]
MTSLEKQLDALSADAAPELAESLDGNKVRCHACGHECIVAPGKRGICGMRFNMDGRLRVPSGYAAGIACDPIEKKPFFHVLPGANALSFGMLGCNFHCPFCQNWVSSQTLRDSSAKPSFTEITAQEIIHLAMRHRAKIVSSTYNEPLITSEWAVEIFKLARENHLLCSYVSNGYASPRVIEFLQPWLKCFKVDLKCFNDASYLKWGGVLKDVCDTIVMLKERGFWVEIVTLLIPGINDEPLELNSLARFIASISPDIPWHVTAYHDNYHMRGHGSTPVSTLVRAAEIGRKAGLHFVYAGNLPGQTGSLENTCCHKCGGLLIERRGFRVLRNELDSHGRCPKCGVLIPGVWRW